MYEYMRFKRLQPSRMFQAVGGRAEVCCCCGCEWSVSLTAEWPNGYICPACCGRMRRQEGGR